MRREYRQVRATNDDRYCLVRNTGIREAIVVHRGREFTLRPGALAVLKLDEPFFSAEASRPYALAISAPLALVTRSPDVKCLFRFEEYHESATSWQFEQSLPL